MAWRKIKKVWKGLVASSLVLAFVGLVNHVGNLKSAYETISWSLDGVKGLLSFEDPAFVEAKGEGDLRQRLHLAKLQATDYRIPSSSSAVIKFLSLPMLNDFENEQVREDFLLNYSLASTVSPIQSTSSDQVFDGGDCRFGVKAKNVDMERMLASFELVSLSCTDNRGYAYSYEPKYPFGYISPINDPGKTLIKIVDDDHYLTIDVDNNYFAQFFKPVASIDLMGQSVVGRF